jgi:uncharacterized damage-inducible protein DinB
MLEVTATQPGADEYAPYYGKYIVLVPAGDVVATLTRQLDDTLSLLRGLSDEQADSRYAPSKWSVKEVVGHIIDAERIFGHRAFRFARNDQTPIPGFEQDGYVLAADFGQRRIEDLAEEFEHVRRANLHLFRHLSEEAWLRRGVASENEVSVRALAHIMAGHETHHMQIIRTKYL